MCDYFKEHKYIQVTWSDKRSLDANAAIRMCYKQIQQYRDDMTAKDVERMCKLTYGVPILSRDCEMREYVFRKTMEKLNYEQRLKVMDCFTVTSDMTAKQASEMIECMMQDHGYIVLER